MDYIRIYEAFIKDRRAKGPTLTGYTERHHVLPRSMGGDNDPGNLIDLTAEDHFFAHLLLAKAHNTRKMWGAVMLMLGARRAGAGRFELRRKATKWRKSYGMVKRAWAAVHVGINGCNADLEIRDFYHFDGRHFRGARIEFSEAHGVPAASVNQLVQLRSAHCLGWSLTPLCGVTYLEEKKKRAQAAGRLLKGFTRRPDLHCFYNSKSGGSVIATQKGMIALGHLSRQSVSKLCRGESYASAGWCLIENAEWSFDRANKRGKYCASYSSDVHDFVNSVTGETFTGTIWGAGQAFNAGDGRPFGAAVSGVKSGWKGWHLVGKKAPKVQLLQYALTNLLDGATVSGTTKQIAEKIGVTPVAVQRVLTGASVHTQGWCLDVDKAKEALPRRTKLQLDRGFLPYPGRQGRGEEGAAA